MFNHGSGKAFAGRSVAIVSFGLIVGAITAVWSVQIISQGFWPELVPTNLSCRAGVVRLIRTLERARQSAAAQEGEQSAVTSFRTEMDPEWRSFRQLRQVCSNDSSARKVLVKLERLRFAEEHAVRYAARDVAFLRREIDRVQEEWSASPGGE